MRSFQAFISAAALMLRASAQSYYGSSDTQNLDPNADLDMMGNNTLFTRWRPQYHFLAPAGWMNDPCGAVYDPTEDTYHLMYQWHTNHVQWGNMSWGHATSKDMVHWTDIRGWEGDNSVSLTTDTPYDRRGVFTGTIQPVNITGGHDGTLLAFYTAVSELPTNWKLPYIPHTEKQALAMSTDGGKTWTKYAENPILSEHPEGWNITGWRDPYYEPWPAMDAILGNEEPHYYMVMGSGIKEVGPRIPFYSAPASDLTKWTFLGALWEPKANETFGDIEVTGSYGLNFEVSNFFSLPDSDGELHHYVTMGAEGGSIPAHGRWSLWSEGLVTKGKNGSADFSVVSSGVADWGNLYAITAFHDTKPRHPRRIAWGWADEDMNQYGVRAQGFQGALGLPRLNFVHKTHNVVAEPESPWTSKSSFLTTYNPDGTFTATTMGAKPLSDVVDALHKAAKGSWKTKGGIHKTTKLLPKTKSAQFHMKATLSAAKGQVGFIVRASPDLEEHTKIIYDPAAHMIHVNRTYSSLIHQFNNATAEGHYYAPLILDPKSKKTHREALNFDIFVDGSLLEVFVNDRWALTTRAYPTRGDAMSAGIYIADGASAKVEHICVWSGLGGVFPNRSANTSSTLVYDKPEDTGNGTWWPGW